MRYCIDHCREILFALVPLTVRLELEVSQRTVCLELGRSLDLTQTHTSAGSWQWQQHDSSIYLSIYLSIYPSVYLSVICLSICFGVCNTHANVKWKEGIIFYIPCQKGHYGVNLSSVIASGSQDLTAISMLHLYNPALFRWWLFAKCWYVLLNPRVFGSTWLDHGAGWDTATKKTITFLDTYWNWTWLTLEPISANLIFWFSEFKI